MGFAYDYSRSNPDDLNVEKNPVLFNRVGTLRDWLTARDFREDDRKKLRVILSGRNTVLPSEPSSSNLESLSSDSTETTAMAKYIEKLSDTHPALKGLSIFQENFSITLFDSAIFTFWTLKQMVIKEEAKNTQNLEMQKEVEMSLFTSDF